MSGQARLHKLTRKMLRPVGYGGAAELYRDPKREPVMTEPEQDNGPAPPTGLIM